MPAILSLHREAFGSDEGATIAKLVSELLQSEPARTILSLVATDDTEICGHVLFTMVFNAHHSTLNARILAPLAVAPRCQGRGIGATLVNNGLAELARRQVDAVFVLGDPKYYSRFGFHTDHSIDPPYALPYPEAWQAKALNPGALDGKTGTIQCAAALQDPVHW